MYDKRDEWLLEDKNKTLILKEIVGECSGIEQEAGRFAFESAGAFICRGRLLAIGR